MFKEVYEMIEYTSKVTHKELKGINGFFMLFAILILEVLLITFFFVGVTSFNLPFALFGGIFGWGMIPFLFAGFKVIHPNEAAVYTVFGNYSGTLTEPGFYWINPFSVSMNPTTQPMALAMLETSDKKKGTGESKPTTSKKISLKATTLNNEKQKVNDSDGNPIEIGVVVIWRVVNPTKAAFDVDNYKTYVSIQCDASIREIARQYPYDISEHGDEKSLRGSSQEVAEELQKILQSRAEMAGLEIMEAKITHLAYAPEIAAAMLQRQQATAIIAARQKIVEGAVGMVEMALKKLADNGTVHLDEERKAAMVSNLLVVLCGNRDAQPIVNSGSIY
jgi:regulator of protease activity HflC (stomatin/prohibitin superfamily)